MKYFQQIAYNNIILDMVILCIPIVSLFSSHICSTMMCIVFLYGMLHLNQTAVQIQQPWHALKLELLFFVLMLVSLFLSDQPGINIVLFLKVTTLFVMFALLINNTVHLYSYFAQTRNILILGVLVGIICFLVEYGFNGIIYKALHLNEVIYTHDLLKEYCTLLSMISWVVIGILLKCKKQGLAIIYSCCICFCLAISGSLSSFVGFVISGVIFLLARCVSIKILKLVSMWLIIGSLSIPIVFYFVNPKEASDKLTFMPLSSKVRIFLWHFVAEKSVDNIVFGHGIFKSKNYTRNYKVSYDGYSENPVHVHNTVLQVLFELGIIGLGVFLAIIYKITVKIEKIARQNINLGTITYAFFINYYLISMTYYSIWRTFWIISGAFVAFMLKIMIESHNDDILFQL